MSTNKEGDLRKEKVAMEPEPYEEGERRKVPRKKARLDVDYTLDTHFDNKGDVRLSHTWTNDIGELGICVSAPESFPIGSKLLLMVHLPHQTQPVPVIAKVNWTRRIHTEPDFKVGCEFVAITEEDRKRILEFVSNQ